MLPSLRTTASRLITSVSYHTHKCNRAWRNAPKTLTNNNSSLQFSTSSPRPTVTPPASDQFASDVVTSDKISVDQVKIDTIQSEPVQNLQMKMEEEGTKLTATEEPSVDIDKLYKTLELEVIAYEPSVLDSYQWFVLTSASHLGITVGKCWAPLKSDKDRFPLLKSAFVHKKHQVHYEFRAYHRFFTFQKLTGSTATTFLEYIQRNLPEGCGLKVTKVEAQPLPKYLNRH